MILFWLHECAPACACGGDRSIREDFAMNCFILESRRKSGFPFSRKEEDGDRGYHKSRKHSPRTSVITIHKIHGVPALVDMGMFKVLHKRMEIWNASGIQNHFSTFTSRASSKEPLDLDYLPRELSQCPCKKSKQDSNGNSRIEQQPGQWLRSVQLLP